jgi:hypothetical protein
LTFLCNSQNLPHGISGRLQFGLLQVILNNMYQKSINFKKIVSDVSLVS